MPKVTKNIFKNTTRKYTKKATPQHPKMTPNGSPNPPRELQNHAQMSDTDRGNPLFGSPGFKSGPLRAQTAPRGRHSEPPSPPKQQQATRVDARRHSGKSFGVHFFYFWLPLLCTSGSCCPLALSIHQPVNTSNQQPTTAATLQYVAPTTNRQHSIL